MKVYKVKARSYRVVGRALFVKDWNDTEEFIPLSCCHVQDNNIWVADFILVQKKLMYSLKSLCEMNIKTGKKYATVEEYIPPKVIIDVEEIEELKR